MRRRLKVLVVGRSGQLARTLVERGAGLPGLELVALGRPDLDLEQPGSAALGIARTGADVVINAAAFTAVDKAEEEPQRAFRVNAAGAAEVAEAAHQIGARLLHISTDYVFAGRTGQAYSAQDVPEPVNEYGRSKLQGEFRVRGITRDHLILRTSWVYGPFAGSFVSTMLKLAARQSWVGVVDDQHGTPTSVMDLTDGLLTVLKTWQHDQDAALGRTMHLAGADVASWAEFARGIFADAERIGLPSARVIPIPSAEYPTPARRPSNSALDSSDFKDVFGFQASGWRHSLPPVLARFAGRDHLDRAGEIR
jgi:dTDP-4-dehydrorhamnose reductase